MTENEILTAAYLVINLPCVDTCPFNKACARKFKDGGCVDRIDKFIGAEVYGNPSNKTVVGGEIKFTTTEPSGEVTISDGAANISR